MPIESALHTLKPSAGPVCAVHLVTGGGPFYAAHMTLHLTSASQALFPWPQDAHALINLLLGPHHGFHAVSPTPGRAVVAAPQVLWNDALMRAFDAAATVLPARLAVHCNPMTEFTASLDGPTLTPDGSARVYDLFLTSEDSPPPSLEELRAQAAVVTLSLECSSTPILTAGYGPPPHTIMLPQGGPLVAQITHWPYLLWLLHMVPYAQRLALLGAKRANSLANVLGDGVRIHKTAWVERSVLGDGVQVEAHATIMDSVVGAGCKIADHSALHHCVVGEKCNTLGDSFLRRCVAFPQSTLSNVDLRETMLGQGVFITAGVIFFTGTAGENAPFGQDPEHLRDSGHPELGGAVGHGCVLGARAMFEPGRALPGGVVVVMRPEEGVLHIPQNLKPGTVTAWDNAQLVPVVERWPGYNPPEL